MALPPSAREAGMRGEGPGLQQASGEHLPELLSSAGPLRHYLSS